MVKGTISGIILKIVFFVVVMTLNIPLTTAQATPLTQAKMPDESTTLTGGIKNKISPTFHPNDVPEAAPLYPTGKITFVSNRDGNDEIYIMNADGTGQTRLTDNSFTDDNPKLSVDGSKIVFNSNRDGNSEIYSMNVDGTNQTRLTNNTAEDAEPAWSPDGNKVAFSSNISGNRQIWVMNANGSNSVQLTFYPDPVNPELLTTKYQPEWSRDGNRIVLSSHGFGNMFYIQVMNADGNNLQLVQSSSNVSIIEEPTWSPDNLHIAFLYSGSEGDFIQILTLVPSTDNLSVPRFSNSPSYSPDGSMIAFQTNHDGNHEIYIMNADGTEQTRITNNPADDRKPSWSITKVIPNQAPTNIILSSDNVAENKAIGTAVGILSTIDLDTNNTFTYSLAAGTGSEDKSAFVVDNNTLRTAATFDYETKNTYNIRVRTTDQGGLYYEKTFIIKVLDEFEIHNQAPTDISLSNNSILENQSTGSVVGNLSTSDPDATDSFFYTMVTGSGDADNALFYINGNSLRAWVVFDYEVKNTYTIRVKTTDSGNLSLEKSFNISVTDINESPKNGGDGSNWGGFTGGGGILSGPGITVLIPYINYNGLFMLEATAKSDDGKVNLNIAKGILGRINDNTALKSVKIVPYENPTSQLTGGQFVSTIYELSPEGAVFSPEIRLTMFFDAAEIPIDIDPNSLYITFFNPITSQWEQLDSEHDPNKSSLTTKISHLGLFCIAGKLSTPEINPPIIPTNVVSSAKFEIIDLTVNPAPGQIASAGQTTKVITAQIRNTGESPGEYSAVLKINGMVVEIQQVIIEAGDSNFITFIISRNEPGIYVVDINGTSTSFNIQQLKPTNTLPEPDITTASSTRRVPSNWLTIGIIVFVSLAFVLVMIIFKRHTN